MTALPRTIPGLVQVELEAGARAEAGAPPRLLIEVPHGADTRAHFDHVRRQLQGRLPMGLVDWFFVNTDVGAWDVARQVARSVVALRPTWSVMLVRALVPRTFVDFNRNLQDPDTRTMAEGGLTPGLAPYIGDPGDQALLRALHARYVSLTDDAFEAVCGRGGRALYCHTYAPRTVGIDQVDEHIVEAIRAAWAPGTFETWPLRAEVDLITRDAEGVRLCIPGAVEALLALYADHGVQAVEGEAYYLHPSTRAATLSQRYPGQTLGVELRRDRVVREWTPFAEMDPDPAKVRALALPLATVLAQETP